MKGVRQRWTDGRTERGTGRTCEWVTDCGRWSGLSQSHTLALVLDKLSDLVKEQRTHVVAFQELVSRHPRVIACIVR